MSFHKEAQRPKSPFPRLLAGEGQTSAEARLGCSPGTEKAGEVDSRGALRNRSEDEADEDTKKERLVTQHVARANSLIVEEVFERKKIEETPSFADGTQESLVDTPQQTRGVSSGEGCDSVEGFASEREKERCGTSSRAAREKEGEEEKGGYETEEEREGVVCLVEEEKEKKGGEPQQEGDTQQERQEAKAVDEGLSALVLARQEPKEEEGPGDREGEDDGGADYWSVIDPTLEVSSEDVGTDGEAKDRSWGRRKTPPGADQDRSKRRDLPHTSGRAAVRAAAPEEPQDTEDNTQPLQSGRRIVRGNEEEEEDSFTLVETSNHSQKKVGSGDRRTTQELGKDSPHAQLGPRGKEKASVGRQQETRRNPSFYTHSEFKQKQDHETEEGEEEEDGNTSAEDWQVSSSSSFVKVGQNGGGDRHRSVVKAGEGTVERRGPPQTPSMTDGDSRTREDATAAITTSPLGQHRGKKGRDRGEEEGGEEEDTLKAQNLLTLLFPEEEFRRRGAQKVRHLLFRKDLSSFCGRRGD